MWASATISLAMVLSLDGAIEAARQHHPSLRRARAQTAAAGERIAEAKAAWFPQVAGEYDFQRTTANFSPRPGTVPPQFIGGGRASWKGYNFNALSVTVSQLMWDFGRTNGRIDSARSSREATAADESEALLEVVVGVRRAFFDAVAKRALVDVAQEALLNTLRHVVEVEALVSVGRRPEIDLFQIRTDEANARVRLVDAQNAARTALATLDVAMGRAPSGEYELQPVSMAQVSDEDSEPRGLFAEAEWARPLVRRALANLQAKRSDVASIVAEWWPQLSAQTAVTDVGPTVPELTWNWNATLFLKVPLLEGGRTVARIAEGSANVTAAEAEVTAARHQVLLEVEEARLGVRAGREALVASRAALVNARERLRLAEGRYETGAGSILELGDSQLARTDAEAQAVNAEYSLASARARLVRALGRP